MSQAGQARSGGSSGGDVIGPGSSTDRAIATWNGATGTLLYDNSTVKISSAGIQTNTTQPALFAYQNANVSNVTGDGTSYTVICDVAFTQQGSNYNTGTGVFTAPVTGFYLFTATVDCSDIGVAHTQGQIFIQTTTINLYGFQGNFATMRELFSGSNFLSCNAMGIVKMTAGDTAKVVIQVSGSTKTIDVVGGGFTYFTAYQLC